MNATAIEVLTAKHAFLDIRTTFAVSDFEHDKHALTLPGAPETFVWAIGSGGTWLAHPGQTFTNAYSYAQSIFDNFEHVYMYDNGTLTFIDEITVVAEFLLNRR